jgi:hypothetical protein
LVVLACFFFCDAAAGSASSLFLLLLQQLLHRLVSIALLLHFILSGLGTCSVVSFVAVRGQLRLRKTAGIRTKTLLAAVCYNTTTLLFMTMT